MTWHLEEIIELRCALTVSGPVGNQLSMTAFSQNYGCHVRHEPITEPSVTDIGDRFLARRQPDMRYSGVQKPRFEKSLLKTIVGRP